MTSKYEVMCLCAVEVRFKKYDKMRKMFEYKKAKILFKTRSSDLLKICQKAQSLEEWRSKKL